MLGFLKFWNWKKKKKVVEPESKAPLKLVYTSNDGTNWYEYENILQIPARRGIAAEVATRMADMNLTKPKFKVIIEKMKQFGNNGDIVSLFALLSEVEFRLDFIGEEDTIKEFATLYFLIEGENGEIVDEVAKRRKIEIFKQDAEAEAFFLRKGFETITEYSNTSEIDILDYLVRNQVANKKLNSYLQA